MTSWERITALYGAARELAPQERAAFLDVACASHPELRQEVERLLVDAAQDDRFLAEPLVEGRGLLNGIPIQHALAPGALLNERYEIDGLIGSGGQSHVYLADDTLLAKRVVIKVFRPETAGVEVIKARFEEEKRALARIDHPSVVGILDVGTLSDGSLFLVIQHVDGRSLRDLVRRGPLQPARAARIIRAIGAALGAAHAVGVSHQDLKPENVMVQTLADRTEAVKLIDFGIARIDRSTKTATVATVKSRGGVIGSVRYMAPEQFEGRRSAAADAVRARAGDVRVALGTA